MLRDLPSPFSYDVDFTEQILMTGVTTAPNDDALTSPPELFDDVFGYEPEPSTSAQENVDDLSSNDVNHSTSHHPSDIPRLRSTHVTSGYREGLSASKEKYLQEGFDEGYSLGAELALKAGWCLGMLEGMSRDIPHRSNDGQDEGEAERTKLAKTTTEAESALRVESLCGREWFGEDGVWTFDVPGQEDVEAEVSFAEVASAHPIIMHWIGVVKEMSTKRGLRLS